MVAIVVSMLSMAPGVARAQLEFGREPINYDSAKSDDGVARLQKELDDGKAKLEFSETHGYLPDVLKKLGISQASQMLVYSKTSFQLRKISPQTPRAIYFNDESYVGWVPNGDVIEVMSTDPDLGQVFYTLPQKPSPLPRFIRDRGQCLTCHATTRTQNVPGALVRSVFVDRTGQPDFSSGTYTTDHRSPFKERWGGWYVTGTHGSMRHMGNDVPPRRLPDSEAEEAARRETFANIVDLKGRFDLSNYLAPDSDIVALMTLEHQAQMGNFITLANYETRSATHYDGIMNEALERDPNFVSDTTKRRIASAGDKLVKYLLFSEEFQLTDPVKGTSPFTKEFESRGPRDSKGRSLREFDLTRRLFKYPCSYLIYSPSFDRLPQPAMTHVVSRLHRVLTGKDQDKAFAHLSAEDRQAILEILTETKPDLWKHVREESSPAEVEQ